MADQFLILISSSDEGEHTEWATVTMTTTPCNKSEVRTLIPLLIILMYQHSMKKIHPYCPLKSNNNDHSYKQAHKWRNPTIMITVINKLTNGKMPYTWLAIDLLFATKPLATLHDYRDKYN